MFGQGEQDHGEFLLVDFTVPVEVAATQDRLLNVEQILSVVVLCKRWSPVSLGFNRFFQTGFESYLLDEFEQILEESSQLLVLNRSVVVLWRAMAIVIDIFEFQFELGPIDIGEFE